MINSFKPSNIQIEENYKSSSPMVLSDPVRIHQIILNLCNNSINALKEKGGDIENILDMFDPEQTFVSARGLEPGDYVRLSVIDNGPGISEDIVERIFEPFFTTKEIGHGSGLGLSVVHEIAKRSGGAVSVESEPGKKTAFHILLPVTAGVEDNDNPSIIEKIHQGNERILFVDDDVDLLETYGEMLGIFGYEVEMQDNSINALDMFRKQPAQYDLVITDNMMPGMTGMELIEKIGNIRQDIPIILCSASNEKVDREKAIAAGGKAFLMKPFSQKEIADLIRNVLDK
ncbi:ATP-binding protein [Desulfobacterales bacterium HSG16]|nr:ATP-binding protein [Desulfobacterales bacterium HSG16]